MASRCHNGDYRLQSSVLLSPNSACLLIGSGNLFSIADLAWQQVLPNAFQNGVWLDSGTLCFLRTVSDESRLDKYDSGANWRRETVIRGEALAVAEHVDTLVAATLDAAELVFTTFSVD